MLGIYKQHPPPLIKYQDELTSELVEVPELMADHCPHFSSSYNYSVHFQQRRLCEEGRPLNFDTDQELPYNASFTIAELNHSLSNCRNNTPGHDKITYRMIAKSNKTAKPSCYQYIIKSGHSTPFPLSGAWELCCLF